MDAVHGFAVVCWGVGITIWILAAFAVKRTVERQPLPRRLWDLALTAVAAILLFAVARTIDWNRELLPRSAAVGIVGDCFLLAGLCVAVWARATLGGNWSASVALKEDHELIQRGPYRAVRHPIYSGLLLMILGTAILIGQVGAFVVLAFCACGLWVKLRREEALLAKHFPQYSAYVRRTKALVPFVL